MSYAANIQIEGSESRFLVVLKPRRKVTGWSVHSGSVYVASFDYGYVSGVSVDGYNYVEWTNNDLGPGEFFFDWSTNNLYVRTTDSSTPADNFVTAIYEMHLATEPLNWHRVPTDSATAQTHFEGLISVSPEAKSALSDSVFGYMPIQSSQLQVGAGSGLFDRHLYDSSFRNVDVDVYHACGPIAVDNIKLLHRMTCESVSGSDSDLSFALVSRLALFETQFTGQLFSGSNVDPTYVGRPVPWIYGVANGVRGVNVDYSETEVVGNNDVWAFGQASILYNKSSTYDFLINSGSTTTRTYISDTSSISVGDRVHLKDKTFPTMPTRHEYVEVTAVGANYIEHAALGSSMPSTGSGHTFQIPRVDVIQNGEKIEAFPGRDYAVQTNGLLRVAFYTDFQNTYLSKPMSTSDTVYARVYGSTSLPTYSGGAFGTGYVGGVGIPGYTNPVIIIFDILMNRVFLDESEIDVAAFESLVQTETEDIGLSVPFRATEDFPTFKELLQQICATCLYRLYLNDDNKWTIQKVAPLGASDVTLQDADIKRGSIGFAFDYSEIYSDIVVEYLHRDVSENPNEFDGLPMRVTATSNVAKYLHGVSRSKTFKSFHILSSDAQTLANRLSYIFGDRRGEFRISSGLSQATRLPGDVVTIERERLPGYAFVDGAERTRSGVVVDVAKSIRDVALVIDDQKGIEDNAGSW